MYVQEIDAGNKPIEGVATSTAGFLGVAERGPTDPLLVTSFSEYARQFGSYVTDRYLARAVEGFFQNGGKRCFVARVVSHDPATPATPASVSTTGDVMTITAIGPGAWANNRLAFTVSDAGLQLQDPALFKLTLMYPSVLEVYDNLSADPLSIDFYERRINDASVLARVRQTAAGRPSLQPQPVFLTNGDDGAALTLADFQGAFTTLLQPAHGMRGLEEIDEVAILCSPDEHAVAGITGELIDQCERLKDRFAILQAPDPPGALDTLHPPTASKYAAFFIPWIRVLDPVTGYPIAIPPGGHIAGVYARSDVERGVHKAPAGEVIRGLYVDPEDPSSGLQIQLSKEQQEILNPRGVNVLRHFPGRGNLVWGARTTTLDSDWKYVNVRRLFIFVEQSIHEGTQWVVFEPNDEPLWARVRRSVSAFLTRLWIDGMFQGRTAEEAYFIRCDRTTMTQADIDNGRLIMLIGIAPVRPAEFVIFRIGQWTGGSEVTES